MKNEDLLLAKGQPEAILRLGHVGPKSRLDRKSGDDISITDGEWIIQFGMFGWLGYLSLFGLFTSSLLRARSGRPRAGDGSRRSFWEA